MPRATICDHICGHPGCDGVFRAEVGEALAGAARHAAASGHPRAGYGLLRKAYVPTETWQRMLTRLPDLTSHRRALSDDRRRLAVSAYIWTLVTEGEPDFAPCPPHIAPDPALRAVRTRERHNVFHWLRTTDHQPYYGALKPLLEDHAKHLAKAVDRTGSSTLPVPAARTMLASSP
ncbi:hypothetical protein ACFVRB_41795 [Streptomyces nojiriensis]|uniref:hypothetical protein n=1 Tax=Streptomyces nojiriensis TaxID=66374 RepID=UPI0036DCA5F6